uniref:Xylulokinase n=1 Tax=uncultured marine thaumarchaeote KM3_53_E03 TaxID=1456184 RepID=A0A075HD17_9ARCH|nr:xylulokinase [uncultured marine thaumarchaeote KM3_53_E03]
MGIDVGTSGVKVLLINTEGNIVSEATTQQNVIQVNPTWTEQDPETWWQNTISSINKVLSDSSSLPYPIDISCIGITGQMHSSVFLDNSGDSIRPAILWNDSRTTLQCKHIHDSVGMDFLYNEIGNLALEGFTAPKILWLQENEPHHYERVHRVIMPKDYIRYRMTGELGTDHSDAAGTILYNVRTKKWSNKLLKALNIDPDILPQICDSTDICGSVSNLIASELGLKKGTPVVFGGADNAVGAVSSGVVTTGQTQSSLGTSGTLLTLISKPNVTKEMNLHLFTHCISDKWYLMGTILSAGNSLKWLKETFASKQTYESLVKNSSQIGPGAEGLIFLPYLNGERTPHNNPNARGVFFGIHSGHTLSHFTKAVLEGVCFAIKDTSEIIKTLGISLNNIRGIGGGNQNRTWRQIQSDVLDLPVSNISPGGGPSYGAAMLASVGVGHFSSINDCVDSWIKETDVIHPNNSNVELYQSIYETYKSLYPVLKDSFNATPL